MRTRLALFLVLTACTTDPDSSSSSPPPQPTEALPEYPFDYAVDKADMSILYPLDATTDPAALVAADLQTTHGRLVPADLGPDALIRDTSTLRLIGLRVDPCSARGGCTPEVRAVFQPVHASGAGATLAEDAAAHVFYDLPRAELEMMIRQLLTLKKTHGSGVSYPNALGPHPILVAQGLDSAFADGLRSLVREHLGEERVQRVTQMVHSFPDEDAWMFTNLERTSGSAFGAKMIVGVGPRVQTLVGSSAEAVDVGGIRPDDQTSPVVPALAPLVSYDRPAEATADVTNAFAAAEQLLDPKAHDAENTDCGSCHLAEGALRAGVELYGLARTTESPAYVRQARSLTNLHAFGYLGTSVSVMERTAIESFQIAAQIQDQLVPL